MIYRCECEVCGHKWPCTKPLTKCLACTEAAGEEYGIVHGVLRSADVV